MKWILWSLSLSLMLALTISSCAPGAEQEQSAADMVEEEPAPIDTATVGPAATESLPMPQATPVPSPTEIVFLDRTVERIPVIYSHGGAPCDIAATVFLKQHPNVELIGMVLSRGEFHPEIAQRKWSVFLYDVLDLNGTSLALGTEKRLDPNSHDFPDEWRPLADSFWNLDLPVSFNQYNVTSSPELIIDLVNQSPEKVTLVAMASLADIALALQQDPDIKNNIAQIVIMGGAFAVPGNLSDSPQPINNQVAEWNIWIDSLAAKSVFDSGVPISIVPLDGVQYLVDYDDLATINAIGDPDVEYVQRMWNQQRGWGGPFLIWDAITITAVTDPENFYWTYDGVDVITEDGNFQGQTVPLNNGAEHIRYANGADYAAIMDLIFQTFRGETPAWNQPSEGTRSVDSPDPAPLITELGGTWSGFTTGSFEITFILRHECQLNQVCGTFEIPEFSLTGDISFINIEGSRFEFRATNLSSGVESAAVYEYLELLEDGTVKYVTEGVSEGSEGILSKED